MAMRAGDGNHMATTCFEGLGSTTAHRNMHVGHACRNTAMQYLA